MPTEVSMTIAIISQMYFGSIGMKKKPTEVAAQMSAAMRKARFLEPAHLVNAGERPPNIMQVTSPKVMKTV